MLRVFFAFSRRRSVSSLILSNSLALVMCAPILRADENPAGRPAPEQTHAASSSPASNPVKLSAVDSVIEQAIADGNIPGSVLLVGHNGKVVYRKAYGRRSLEPRRELMTLDTIFDLASLTKVIATTTSVMQLVELGKVRLNDPVAKYIPEFAQNGKDDITVRQLLTHYSGLAPDLDLGTPWEGKQTAYQLACVMPPETTPGSGFVYSDINFIMLGELVEKVSGETLDAYTAQHIFTPLKMTHTRPGDRRSRPRSMTSKTRCCTEWCMIPRRGAWEAWRGTQVCSPLAMIWRNLRRRCSMAGTESFRRQR